MVDAVRTPVGTRGGQLCDWHPVDLPARTLTKLVERMGSARDCLADVIAGCAIQTGEPACNVARNATLGADLTLPRPRTNDTRCIAKPREHPP